MPPRVPCGVSPDTPLCPGCGRHRPRAPYALCKPCRKKACSAPPCVHCRTRPATRPRGLCGVCFRDDAVRRCYEPEWNREPDHGVPDFPAWTESKAPPRPTEAEPGSPAKIGVLMARAELARRGRPVALHHPLDQKAASGRHRAVKTVRRLLSAFGLP